MPVRSARDPSPALGFAVGLGLTMVVAAALVPLRNGATRATPALLLVLPVVAAGVIGSRVAALVTAVVAAGAFNVAFIPPYWTPKVAVVDDAVALGVFLVVAAAVGTFVAREAERRRAAEQRAEETQALYDRYEALVAERERLAEETTRLAILEQVDAQRSALLRSVSTCARHWPPSEPSPRTCGKGLPMTTPPGTSCSTSSATRPKDWTAWWPTCST